MDQAVIQILKFIQPSVRHIETLPPTAWGGHIPFMFCLMNCLRPRNYVELGTHYGASFFAVCQAIQELKIECVPTAIDLWKGDQHAGLYEEDVFKEFSRIHDNKYNGIGQIVRKEFNIAADDYERHSIDLIHIDGLHSYEAVRNDYEKWFSKLSKNGVMLFHDTIVKKKGFGVWKLWDEIKNNYTSFNFTHSNGLGIIALGSADENPMVFLLDNINKSVETQKLFDSFFARVGEKALTEALLREDLRKYQDPYRKIKLIYELIKRYQRKLYSLKPKNTFF